MEKGLHEVSKSMKELGTHNQDQSLLLADKYKTSSIGDGVEYDSAAINAT